MPARIIIADPDESFGLMLKQILELNGEYLVETFTAGSLALASARKRKPDLVIVDAALADMSPAALITSLQLVRPGIPVMLIPMGGTLPEEFQRLGVRGILTKPFFVGNLSKYIGDALGKESRPLVDMPPAFANETGAKPPAKTPVSPALVRPAPPPPPRPTTNAPTEIKSPTNRDAKPVATSQTAGKRERPETVAGDVTAGPAMPTAAESKGPPPAWVAALGAAGLASEAPSSPAPSTHSMPALNQTAPLAPKSERTGAQPAAEKPARATAAPRVRQTITPPRRGTPATEAPQQAIGPGADTQASIDRALATLSRELRADAIFVLKDGALLTQRGNLPGLQVESVAGVLRRWASTAAELAAIVGENNSRFAQFHAEGERYHVYSYDTGSGLMLVVICRTDIPFGTLRLSLKAAGAQLAKLAR